MINLVQQSVAFNKELQMAHDRKAGQLEDAFQKLIKLAKVPFGPCVFRIFCSPLDDILLRYAELYIVAARRQ